MTVQEILMTTIEKMPGQHEKEKTMDSRLEQAYQAEKEKEELPHHHRNLNLPNL